MWMLKHVRFTSVAFRREISLIAGIAMRCRAKNIFGFLIPMYHPNKGNYNWRNRKRNSNGEEKQNRDEIISGYFGRELPET